ncbi:hypothetical protein AZE42_07290, partial [Rhizopogon vesiculosus]
MKAFHDPVQNGKVRYIDASSMRYWQFAMLNDVAAKNGSTKFEREILVTVTTTVLELYSISLWLVESSHVPQGRHLAVAKA